MGAVRAFCTLEEVDNGAFVLLLEISADGRTNWTVAFRANFVRRTVTES